MYTVLIYLISLISFMIIILILLQPSKQQDSLSLLSTDKSETLFKKQRSYSFNNVLQLLTATLAVAWIALGIVLMYLGKN